MRASTQTALQNAGERIERHAPACAFAVAGRALMHEACAARQHPPSSGDRCVRSTHLALVCSAWRSTHLLDVALVDFAVQLQVQLVAVRFWAGGMADGATTEGQLARLGRRVVGDAAGGGRGSQVAWLAGRCPYLPG